MGCCGLGEGQPVLALIRIKLHVSCKTQIKLLFVAANIYFVFNSELPVHSHYSPAFRKYGYLDAGAINFLPVLANT
jgi:hypothetical protein